MLFDKSKLYEEYCVAFVDILGFKSMTAHGKLIENGPIINEAIENMKNIFSVQIVVVKDGILQIRELNQIDQVYKKIQTLQFADSIALLFPKEPYVSLLAIQRLMSLQFHLLTKGILIRGAICTGEMYIDSEQNIYYGEAWNNAVLNEGKAGYPRIIVDESIAEMIGKWLAGINEGILELNKGKDYWELDSYKGYFWYQNTLGITYKEGINYFICNVESKIKEIQMEDSVWKKYLWVIDAIISASTYLEDLQKDVRNLKKKLSEKRVEK